MRGQAITTAELMKLVEAWRPADEARRLAEAERLAELWAGITPGAVELTEEASVRRGGLRIVRGDGSVVVEVVELLGVEGDVARVRTTGGRGYQVIERLPRSDVKGMWVKEEEVEHGPAVLYWCEGEGVVAPV